MCLSTRLLALAGGLALLGATVAASASAASPTTTFPLHGTKMASTAHGLAHVTRRGAAEYWVVVTIQRMPMPSTLHTAPLRHAYVAWAFDASKMVRPTAGALKPPSKRPANPGALLGKLTPIALHATSASTYTGMGTVRLAHTPGIIVTAEVSALARTPAMPFWGVLIGFPMMQR